MDAGIVVAAAGDGVLLDPIIEVAGAELVLPLELDPTFVLMLAVGAGVAVGVAGTVDGGVAVGAAGSDKLVGGGVKLWPTLTGVLPSDSTTVPFVGSPVI